MKTLKSIPLIITLFLSLSSCIEKGSVTDSGISPDDSTSQPGATTQSGVNQEGDRRYAWQKPEFVIDKLGNLTDKVVADIGAGTGYFTFRLLNKARKIIAVDIDTNSIFWINSFKENLDSVNQRKIETRLALPTDPRLGDNEVDVVIIINTIGYIKRHSDYLKNLKQSLKSGGLLMIVDFKMKRISGDIAPDPSNRVSILHLEDDLEEAGYEHLETDDTSLDYQYIILARNQKKS